MSLLNDNKVTVYSFGTAPKGVIRPAGRLESWLTRASERAYHRADRVDTTMMAKGIVGLSWGGILGVAGGTSYAAWTALASGSMAVIAAPGIATAAFIGLPVGAVAGLATVLASDKAKRVISRQFGHMTGGLAQGMARRRRHKPLPRP
ncbi:MAG: hypothetical protein Alpg2KO_19720 [Alphaproteobacteria bacterium]